MWTNGDGATLDSPNKPHSAFNGKKTQAFILQYHILSNLFTYLDWLCKVMNTFIKDSMYFSATF